MPRIHFNPDGRRSPTEFEPVTVHHRKPPLDGIISSHRHNWSQLTCPLKGSMRVTTERQVWTVTSFRAVWIPPGVDHELTMVGATEFHAVFIDPQHSPLPANQCCVVDVSPLMRELMQWLGADYGPATDHSRRLTDVLLEEVRRATRRTSALVLPGDRRLKSLCEALMEDPGSTLTLGEWAHRTGASERTLARLFQIELGTTFGAWRQQLRLSCAVDLLRSGLSLSRIAADLGYADSAAFSTMFKRAFGVAPSRYHASSAQAMN
ncbi:helix-turn-helix domain protein [Paraburkholderia xenovorans LB400]|uniref:Transcriptional regulator, AraC family n=1 Tax=Paraburkholderia xenovorans (strain LB400) TaxID=266265 RepID=Q13ID0_PARXL|nr:transcriptional regulator, AraC family [Paraburkholderia xenovorans LB400]AIP34126.1 helix-turn-helix domain protein [Paraburkholderia xenovorans LB400]